MAAPTCVCACVGLLFLLFLLQKSRCGYYSRLDTNQGVASVRINKITTKLLDFLVVSADLVCMVVLHIMQLCTMWYTALLWLLQFVEVISLPALIGEIILRNFFPVLMIDIVTFTELAKLILANISR